MFKLIKQKNKAGFSIIEVITVLLIVSIGLGGTITLIIQSIQGQNMNKQHLVAYQLAQEGVELIRSRRDNNWLGSYNWDESLDDGAYFMDYTLPEPYSTSPYSNQIGAGRLLLDGNGFYVSSPTSDLPEGQYSRVISLAHTGENGNKITVRVTIYWLDRGQLNSYELENDLYNWL